MHRRINSPDTMADITLRECLAQNKSFIMTAGAGAGKTTSLIKALMHIKEHKGKALRQNNQRIACITYTTIAEEEIWKDVGQDSLFHVSTIHSFLWSIAKPFQNDIKIWVKKRIKEKVSELKNKRSEFGPRVHEKTKVENQKNIERYESMLLEVDYVDHFSYEIGSNYPKGVLGHDDIIKMVPNLIEQHPLLKTIIAKKYPFFFVDESQDTLPEIVQALINVEAHVEKNFCLGFFGDPMQKIYTSGIGQVEKKPHWKKIEKPENFRCSLEVLAVINKIRKNGDSLEQISGKKDQQKGSAHLFIIPTSGNKNEYLDKVRQYLAQNLNDKKWINDKADSDLKVLVIAHRMAAVRLGYADLFAVFNDDASENFKESFKKGSLWVLQPFLNIILPLVEAQQEKNDFKVMDILRTSCPMLKDAKDKKIDSSTLRKQFEKLEKSVSQLSALFMKSDASIKDVLSFSESNELLELDDRFNEIFSLAEDDKASIEAFLKVCPTQLFGYKKYLQNESPFETQQGIKGAEFQRVVVILDDEEGRHNQFSYEKLLNLKEPSDRDQQNLKEGKETVFDRTRRLFYVCCSRALKDLAILLYVSNPEEAYEKIKKENLLQTDFVKTYKDLDQIKINTN